MDEHTYFEDLSNEIFFEIFDYLHALDIFTGFASLNRRISFILQSIPLRIVISYKHCRRQIDFLSSHLTVHDHQVISLQMYDTIHDDSSIISLLFNRHNFINLQSCTFIVIESSKSLENVIKQIKSLNRLVSFTIEQPNDEDLNKNDRNDFTRIVLMHKSPFLRSINLQYSCDYLNICNYRSIPSNLISFKLIISGSSSMVSVYSILSILHLCHTIRRLAILIRYSDLENNNNIDISSQTSSMSNNDFPILSQLISFELIILTRCDSSSIFSILRCMPNLRHFYFHLSIRRATWEFPRELFDGCVWNEMFEIYVPYLSKFEFHMAMVKTTEILDLEIITDSFENFVRKYSDWHMVISRWILDGQIGEEFVVLRTLNYHKHNLNLNKQIPFIYSRSFEIQSTMRTKDYYLFYPDIKEFRIYMTDIRPTITWSSPLFQQSNYLMINIHKSFSLWNGLRNIVNYSGTDDNDLEETITDLSYFVHLLNITHIEFGQRFDDIFKWKYIQFILQACPNVTDLTISTRLLLLSKFIDNPSLISIFKQIKMIQLRTKRCYFPSDFTLKFVQRFPLLNDIELQVFSFDNCVSIIDIFLTQLENLSYIKINYNKDTLLDDPFSRDYIIEKRRQTYPDQNLNEDMMYIKNNGEVIEICLR